MTGPGWLERWKARARDLQVQTYALYLVYRHPATPWYARAFTLLVVAYAFSPVDLIPDFIPVLGYLDDLVLIPAGVALALKMIPGEVMAECRARAEQEYAPSKPAFRAVAVVVIVIWGLVLGVIFFALARRWSSSR